MLDPSSLIQHTQVVLRDRTHAVVSDHAFAAAMRAAQQPLVFPGHAVEASAPEQFVLAYTTALKELMLEHGNVPTPWDRRLVEVVFLLRLLDCVQSEEALGSSKPLHHEVVTWMIQERLIYILLQSGFRSLRKIQGLGSGLVVPLAGWGTRLMQAQVQSKVLQELANQEGVRVYRPSFVEQSRWGIDLFVEVADEPSVGACVSVHLDYGGKSRFLLEPAAGQEALWERIARGAAAWREHSARPWVEALVLIGKHRRPLDLSVNHGGESWARTFSHALKSRSQSPHT